MPACKIFDKSHIRGSQKASWQVEDDSLPIEEVIA